MSAVQANLTHREHEAFSLMLTGLYNKEIADRLSVSVSTVRFHLGNCYRKLGVFSRRDLLQYQVTIVKLDPSTIENRYQSTIANGTQA